MKRLFWLVLLISLIASAQSKLDVSSQAQVPVANDGTTGTTINQLAKINSSGNAINAGPTDTAIPVYIVVGNAGTTGVAQLAVAGPITCKFDASGGTAGHYVIASTTTGSRCADGGASLPTTSWTFGFLLTNPGANANGTVMLLSGFMQGSAGGGGFTGGTLTSELILAASTTGAASLNFQSGTAPTSPAAGDCWRDTTGINCVESTTTNGSIDVRSDQAGSAGPASSVRYTADSNVAKTSVNGGALEFNMLAASALTANQLVAGNGNGEAQAVGSLGTTTTVYHGNAAGLGSFTSVNRADLGADAVGWQFLCTNNNNAGATQSVTCTAGTARKHISCRGLIGGYAGGGGIARWEFGNTTTPDTGTNYSFGGLNLASGTSGTPTLTEIGSGATAQDGVPVSGSTTTAGRFVQLQVSNTGAAVKYFEITTAGVNTAATSTPNFAHIGGFWSNTTSGIGVIQLKGCTALTGTCSAVNLTTTSVTCWGRDDN